MNRFYCRSGDVSGETIIISDPGQLHHLKDVLRFKAGDKAEIFDDKANEFSVVLTGISDKQAEFSVKERKPAGIRRSRLAIACALPKRSKIDDIIDKLTQLGVDRIIPLATERVIVRIDKDKALARQKRWEAIALSASKQSKRNNVPVVDPLTDFGDLIANSREFELKLIPNLEGEREGLKKLLAGKKPSSVLVLIGPEGDFTPDEVRAAKKSGFIPVSFGDFVLRVETAALFAASVLNYEIG